MRLKIPLMSIIDRLENIQLSFSQWFATLLSVIFIRNFLEIFSDAGNFWRVLDFQTFTVHYPLFFIATFFLISLVLHLMSGEKIEKATRIIILFSIIIWSVPLLDLILSLGKGFNISYLKEDFGSLIKRFLTYFGPYSGEGASYGIKIEIGIVLLLIFLYVYLKTGKIIRSIVTPFIIYLCIFILGSTPSWIMITLKGLNNPDASSRFLESEMILNHFYSFDIKISMVLLIIILFELMAWFYLYDKSKFISMLKNIRVARVLHYEVMLVFGMMLAYFASDYKDALTYPISSLIILIALLSVFFAWLCAVGINDLNDVKINAISNRDRPLVSGILKPIEYKNITWIFFILALLFGYLTRYSFLILIAVYIILSYIYSARPFRFRTIPIISSFIIALASLIIMMAGFLIFSQDQSLIHFPKKLILLILVVFTLAINFKDIKDLEGDKEAGITTILTLLGERKGKMIVGGFVIISYLLVPLILDIPILIIFSVICGSASFFIINHKVKMNENLFFLIYFVFMALVCYFYLFQNPRS